jgi:hypothetical protein
MKGMSMGACPGSLLALIASSLLLAGCAAPPYAVSDPPEAIVLRWDRPPGPPLLATGKPDSVTIRWDSTRNTVSDMTYIAERQCLAWDEHAEEVSEEVDGTQRRSTFVCKGPLLR